eukprot:3345343-Prymnesium_polylepis.2
MLPGMRRGPKPGKWKKGVSVGFAAYFARRSEPLNVQPEKEPLTEATEDAGFKWIFTGFGGNEPTQVRASSGSRILISLLSHAKEPLLLLLVEPLKGKFLI